MIWLINSDFYGYMRSLPVPGISVDVRRVTVGV